MVLPRVGVKWIVKCSLYQRLFDIVNRMTEETWHWIFTGLPAVKIMAFIEILSAVYGFLSVSFVV